MSDRRCQQFCSVILLLICWPTLVHVASSTCNGNTDKQLCQDGHVIIGGLFEIFYSMTDTSRNYTDIECMTVMQDSIFEVEAMLYAVDMVNNDSSILPNLTLGYTIQSSCPDSYKDTFFALDMVNSMELEDEQLQDKEKLLFSGEVTLRSTMFPTAVTNVCWDPDAFFETDVAIVALIGPPSSAGAASMASLLRVEQVPVISYSATEPDLSSTVRYPYFYRTIYSDATQAAALADLINHFQWTYIAVLGSDDNLGRDGIYEFKEALEKYSRVCIAQEDYLQLDNTTKMDAIVRKLENNIRENQNLTINATLLYMDMEHIMQLMSRIYVDDRDTAMKNMTWIGVDQWISNWTMNEMFSMFLEGTVATDWSQPDDGRFYKYESDNLFDRIEKNPWFLNYLCQVCREDPRFQSPKFVIPPRCSVDYIKTPTCIQVVYGGWADVVRKQPRAINVINAVYAAAHAIDDLVKQGRYKTLDGYHYLFNLSEVNAALRRVNFTLPGLSRRVAFDANGDMLDPIFNIVNLYDPDAANDKPGVHTVASRSIGQWELHQLTINDSAIRWRHGSSGIIAACSQPCGAGQRVVYSPTRCCWSCQPCPPCSISNQSQSDKCVPCPAHHHATDNQTMCVENTLRWFSWNEPLGLINLVCCALGECFVVVCAFICYCYRHQRPIKSGLTMACITLIDSAVGFTCILYYACEPSTLLCTGRRVTWTQSVSMHCVAGFFMTQQGQSFARKIFGWFSRKPATFCVPMTAHILFSMLALLQTLLAAVYYPVAVDIIDMKDIDGSWDTTFVDCKVDWLSALLVVWYPLLFWCPMLYHAFQSWASERRQRARQTTWNGSPAEMDTSKLLVYATYSTLSVLFVLLPIYFGSQDPWQKNFVILLGALALNYLILLFQMLPRLYSLFFKMDYTRHFNQQEISSNYSSTDVYISSRHITVNLTTSEHESMLAMMEQQAKQGRRRSISTQALPKFKRRYGRLLSVR